MVSETLADVTGIAEQFSGVASRPDPIWRLQRFLEH